MRIGRRDVAITNPGKVFFPRFGPTKGDLVRYYLDARTARSTTSGPGRCT